MSAPVRGIGAVAAATGAGTWVSLGGWPAAAAVAAVLAVALLLVLLVLGSEERTRRMLQIIAALRLGKR